MDRKARSHGLQHPQAARGTGRTAMCRVIGQPHAGHIKLRFINIMDHSVSFQKNDFYSSFPHWARWWLMDDELYLSKGG